MKTMLIAGALAFGSAAPASAVVVLFADFDAISTPTLTAQGFDILPAADGFTGGANGIEIQNGVAGDAFSPSNLVELDTAANSSMFVTLGAGSYTVSYYYSGRPNVAADSNGIDLLIGNTLLDTVTVAGGVNTSFQFRTVSFTTSGADLTFAASGISDGVGGYLDSITLSLVPEPATWGLMIAGFAMVGFAARRKAALTT